MSYANLMMYNSAYPSSGGRKSDEKEKGAKAINADDIANIERINAFGED